MKELKIESNIPIPNYRSTSTIRSTVEKMKNLDSVTVENYSQASYLSSTMRKAGFIAVTRKLPDGKIRVWKTTKATKKK